MQPKQNIPCGCSNCKDILLYERDASGPWSRFDPCSCHLWSSGLETQFPHVYNRDNITEVLGSHKDSTKWHEAIFLCWGTAGMWGRPCFLAASILAFQSFLSPTTLQLHLLLQTLRWSKISAPCFCTRSLPQHLRTGWELVIQYSQYLHLHHKRNNK